MNKRQLSVVVLIIALLTLMLCSCSSMSTDRNTKIAEVTQFVTPQITEPVTSTPMTMPPKPSPTATLPPTPTPFVKLSASLGFVGDIMMMQSQVKNAKTDDGYDFTRSFAPMRKQFMSVDFMCANLETPLAGASAVYSEAAPTVPPATTENPNPQKPYQTFNAPDALAYNLKELGFDMLTTANNHCLDRKYKGLIRTLEVLDKAELLHTGTFYDEDDRNTPCITDINGIQVGFLAFSAGFNGANRKLVGEQSDSISYLYDYDYVKEQIENTKEAGAEFIVVFPHCGVELSLVPENSHKELFRDMLEWGADAIIASHPHVVQPIEWLDIERDDGTSVHAPIVYSLGNFISNMAPSPKDYGLFVTLSIEKTEDGVFARELSYLPVYCIRQYTRNATVHQTLPCYEDTDMIDAYEPLSRDEIKAVKKAREFVINICGKKYVMQDS